MPFLHLYIHVFINFRNFNYYNIKKTLKEFDASHEIKGRNITINDNGFHSKYSIHSYGFTTMHSALGKQILYFLRSICELLTNGGWYDGNPNYDQFLLDIKKVLILVNNRKKNLAGWLEFDSISLLELKTMQDNGVEIAQWALEHTQGYDSEESLDAIANKAVKMIYEKLQGKRIVK